MSKQKQKKKECLAAIEKEIQDLRNLNERLQYYNENLDNVSDYPITDIDSNAIDNTFDSIRLVGKSFDKDAYLKEEAIKLYSKMLDDVSSFCDQYKIDKKNILCNKAERYDSNNKLIYSILVNGTDISVNQNLELIKEYSIQEEYEDFLQKANFTAFLAKIEVSKKSLENGIYGEKRTYHSIRILDDEIKILKNVLISVDDMNEEHDLIVISSKGLFTIEVKYLSVSEIQIMKSGIMKSDKRTYGNVVEQSRRHIHSLRRLLKSSELSDTPIYPIIVVSNDNCEIIKNDSLVPACYRNNIETVILDNEKTDVLGFEKIKKLYDYLSNNCIVNYEKPYSISISPKEFYCLLGDVICSEAKKNKRKEIKEKAEKNEAERKQTLSRNNERIAENNRKIQELEEKYTEIKESKSDARETLELTGTFVGHLLKNILDPLN